MATRKTKSRNPDGNPADEDDFDLSESIARRIVVFAEMNNLSFRDIETRGGLAKGSVAAIVSGRRAGATTVKLIVRVAKVLGVDVGFLITGLQAKHKQPSFSDPEPSALRQLSFPTEEAAQPSRAARPLQRRTKRPRR